MLFCIGTALLWWNEGRTVKTAKMLEEAGGAYVEMENPDKKDASLDGELVCGTAMATTEDSLSDSQFGVGAKAIALHRMVEYYQWVEHAKEQSEDKLGGKEVTTTTYSYSKEWVGSPVESASFHDPAYQKKNMVLTTVETSDQYAENVSFGAYKLNESLIRYISSREALPLTINPDLLKELNKQAQTAYQRFYGTKKAVNDTIVRDSVNKDDLEYVHQSANVLYFGRVPGSPEVGDVRVTFEQVVPAKVTVMAVVSGDSFKAFKAKNGKRFQTLVMGQKTGDEIIASEQDANDFWKWVCRIIGVLLVIAGLNGIFGFIETILKVVPFVAGIFGWGVGVVCTVVGIVWSLIVIAVAWLFYRPLLGIALLAIAALLIWLFAFKGKDKIKELRS